jgi:UTP-glucose-1-phosphate uridylyltransferase
MLDHYKDENSSIISVQKIKKSESVNYGIIEFKEVNKDLIETINIIENLLQKMLLQIMVL